MQSYRIRLHCQRVRTRLPTLLGVHIVCAVSGFQTRVHNRQTKPHKPIPSILVEHEQSTEGHRKPSEHTEVRRVVDLSLQQQLLLSTPAPCSARARGGRFLCAHGAEPAAVPRARGRAAPASGHPGGGVHPVARRGYASA